MRLGLNSNILLIGICCTFVTASDAQEFKQLRIGVDGTNPPFSHRNIDNEYSGFDIDIARELCATMKSKCSFVQYSWDNLVPALRDSKVDLVVASLTANTELRKMANFSQPYFVKPIMAVVRKDSLLSGTKKGDLNNTLFGALKSSSFAEYLRVHYPDVKIKTYENVNASLTDLSNKRLDGAVGDPIQFNIWLNSADGKSCCRKLGLLQHDAQINGEGAAIATRLPDEKLLAAVDKALVNLRTSGKLSKLVQTHFPYLR